MTTASQPARQPTYDRRTDTIAFWRNLARVALVIYVVAVTAFAFWSLGDASRWDPLSIRLEGASWIAQVVSHVTAGIIRELILFWTLGVLAGAACVSTDGKIMILRSLMGILIAFVLALAISMCVSVMLDGMPLVLPPFPITLAIVIVCLWGCNLGVFWVRSQSGLRWFLSQGAFALLFLFVFGRWLSLLALSGQPMDITSESVSTDDRRRLVKLVRSHDPRKLAEGATTDLTLSESDINKLASWGLSLLGEDAKVAIELTDNRIQLNAMVSSPTKMLKGKYFTLSTGGRVIARSGELGFLPDEFQLGRLRMPNWLLEISGPFLVGDEWRYEHTEPFFRSLKEIRVVDQAVTVSYGHLSLEKGMLREALVGLGVLEDLEPSITAQMKRIEELAEANSKVTFAQCMEAVFDEAQKRSVNGQAVRENRAAILTLSYVIGHPRVGALLGGNVPALSRPARAALRSVSLRQRRDWAQHFTISAALKVLSGASISRDLGILKEELDADGGSGFSFGDLLADRSGTMMAVRATQSEQAAVAMQKRITSGFVESDFMPEGSDLPEGLSDEEFQQVYGGVAGDRYQRVVEEIDRRIGECEAFRPHL